MQSTVAGPGDASVLARSFERADQRYGPVPIWWWSGERLERATRRAADFDRRWSPVQTDWVDFIGGRPTPPSTPPAPSQPSRPGQPTP